jgi:lipid-A-disaccharide synthase
MEKIKNILIVAGEASSDLHAANLVEEVKKIYPQAEFFGLGGEKLKKAGVRIYFNLVELAVVGFFEVVKNLNKFRNIFRGILEEVDKVKPDLAILVDYPGFNLRLAKELKKRNIPVVYYISPQVWAWGKNRIKTIKEVVSLMVVLFKFEEELYRKHNIPVSFAGHPLLDIVKAKVSKQELYDRLRLDVKKFSVALLPGSREKEVKTLLPIMLKTAQFINNYFKENVRFLILRSPSVKEDIFNDIMSGHSNLPISMLSDMTYDGLHCSDFALVASGTATLETAILGIPMVILYKVSFLTWAYIRMLIKIPYIGLVNIVAGECVVPEFIQYKAKPEKIASFINTILSNPQELTRIKQLLLDKVRNQLGKEGANQRAASAVVGCLNKKGL